VGVSLLAMRPERSPQKLDMGKISALPRSPATLICATPHIPCGSEPARDEARAVAAEVGSR